METKRKRQGTKRRAAVQALLDKQSKLAQSIYEQLDQKIYQFGEFSNIFLMCSFAGFT
jgi:hypothetical protein